MPLTNAERARRYREKLKSDPEKHRQYLDKEKSRYKERKETGKIKPINELTSDRDIRKKRRQWRINKTRQRNRESNASALTPPLSPNNGVILAQQIPEPIPQPSTSRSLSGRKKTRKDRAQAYRTIGQLKLKLANKEKAVQKFKQQTSRLRNLIQSHNASPRSKVENMLKGKTIDKEVKRALLFHNALVDDVKRLYSASSRQMKRQMSQSMTGRMSLLKKYRLVRTARTLLGVQRTKGRVQKKLTKFTALKRKISAFYNRDDISRIKAGKKETITRQKLKKQKRMLSDTLKNIHLRFLMENAMEHISYSLFCRLRPFWVLFPTISDRDTCMCKIHANVQYMADTLNKWNALLSSDVEKLVEETHCDPESKTCMYGECNQCKERKFASAAYDPGQQVEWSQWQDRIEDVATGIDTKRELKQVKRTVKLQQFGTLEHLREDFQDQKLKISKHIYNIRHQYKAIRSLRETLPEHTAIVHMDFSENYSCKYHSEIQSVHFGASHQQVSLHTGVAYIASDIVGFCTFSDCRRHDPPAIWAHVDPLLRFLKGSDKELQNVHFVSDGPTTQYRCRNNFFMFSTRIFDYGMKTATWNFLEAGHGKGAADGIGAVIKRTVDTLVSQGKDITDAKSMFDSLSSSQLAVKMWFVTEENVISQSEKIPKDVPPVPGTMRLHQVMTDTCGTVLYRDVSCFCGTGQFCQCYHPSSAVLQENAAPKTSDDQPTENEEDAVLIPVACLTTDMEGRWCVVEYDGFPYPGIIQCVDDGEAEVKVMHRIGSNRFFWPSLFDDIVWYPVDKIVTLIPPTERVTARHQQIRPNIWDAITQKLNI